MAIYLYGLVLGRSAHRVPAHITGVGGAPVRVLGCEGLCALVSTLERAPARGVGELRASLDDVRAHDHALQSVVHHGATAASVRFGQTFDSDEDVRRHVDERGARITRLLETHDDCVEMRVLLAMPDEQPATVKREEDIGPGRAYLERLRAADATERVSGLGLREALGPVVREERVEQLPTAHGVAFSHLIQRSHEAEYREALRGLPALAEARIVGPLAFYSFAEPAE